MHNIDKVVTRDDWKIEVVFSSNEVRLFDVKPLLECEAFKELADINEFKKVHNGGYYIEWENEADLSADTLYAEGLPLPA